MHSRVCDHDSVTDQYPGQHGPQPHAQQQPYPGGAASWDYQPSGLQQGAPPTNGWTPAPKAGLIPLRPLSFGEIFGSTFKLLRTNAGVSIGAALIVQGITALIAAGLPLIVTFWAINRISMANASDADLLNSSLPGWIILSVLPGLILSLIGSALLQVIIVQVVAKSVLNRRVKLGEALRTSWSRFWPILGLFGLYFIALLLATVILGLLIALAVWLGTEDGGVFMLLVILATVVLGLGFVVAAIWIGTKLTFAMPAIVLEKMGPIQAIRRSWKLSNGYFWRTFGILLLLQVIIQTMSQVVGGVLGFAMSIAPTFLTPTGGVAEGQESGLVALMIVLLVLSMLLSILIAAIGQVLLTGNAAIMYTDLRMRKEGLNIHLQGALEVFAQGGEPDQDPWLAPDLGPVPQPQPYSAPPYPTQGFGTPETPAQYPAGQYPTGQDGYPQQYPGQDAQGQYGWSGQQGQFGQGPDSGSPYGQGSHGQDSTTGGNRER